MGITRRHFLANAGSSSALAALGLSSNAQMQDMSHMPHDHEESKRPAIPRLPAILCKETGTVGIDAAFKMLLNGRDTLDAALHICTTQEDDPKDHSTGLGGLPNMQGEVQLDACCIHGPTRRAAAVACISGIRNPSLLAKALMDQTGNSLLVGSNASAFAQAQGLSTQDLLTDRSRKNYALWKKIQATPGTLGDGTYNPTWPEPARKIDFLPNSQRELDLLVHRLEPVAAQAGIEPAMTWRAVFDAVSPTAEPLYVSAIDAKGQISSACSSSGRPWRMAGTASDIAMIGAGSFIDPEVGSAGASGNAEANIKIAGAHTIVENMRMGMSPEDAGIDALRRIVRWYNNDMTALRFVEMVYYILRKDGAYGSVSLWRGNRAGYPRQFAIVDDERMRRTEDCRFLIDGGPLNGAVAIR